MFQRLYNGHQTDNSVFSVFLHASGSSTMMVKFSLVRYFPSKIHGGIVILTDTLDKFHHDVCM